MADVVVRETSVRLHHGECPVWWSDGSGLRLVDMLAGDLVRVVGPDEVVRLHVGGTVAAPRPRRGGGAVLGVDDGFVLLREDGTQELAVTDVSDADGLRMNDGSCDPQGRYWCGTIGAPVGAGALHRLDPDGTVTTVLRGVTTSNGLGWRRDGRTAYYVDSRLGRVDVLQTTPEGDVVDRRPFATPPRGTPDGLVVDEADGVWVAIWDGAGVVRFSPEGQVDRVVELPTPRVTACTLGGEDLRTLYITTSRLGLEGDDGCAGAVFSVRVDVPGVPVAEFHG
ncbi:MAG: SMP-30/gluconolactonase/LRE family protein [Nocardioides sp.]|nr:SMP-30/gluconolactonase/LRE family protein [Nocardioides sp.]